MTAIVANLTSLLLMNTACMMTMCIILVYIVLKQLAHRFNETVGRATILSQVLSYVKLGPPVSPMSSSLNSNSFVPQAARLEVLHTQPSLHSHPLHDVRSTAVPVLLAKQQQQ